MLEALDVNLPQLFTGGTTLGLVAAAFRLLYNALKEEKARLVSIGENYHAEMDRMRANQDRMEAAHEKERARWKAETASLHAQIEELRNQMTALYEKVYRIPPQGA